MELDEFVRRTLVNIAKGVQDAIPDASTMGVKFDQALWQDVEFDVAVTTEDSKGGGGRINVFGSSAGGEVQQKDSTVTRIRFKVPILYPQPPDAGWS